MELSFVKNREFTLVLLITISTMFAQEQRNGIIEIKNKTQIHCVSESSGDLAMFTYPHLNKMRTAANLVKSGFWMNDDWTTKNSSHVKGGVFDSRWEDFEVENIKFLRFNSKGLDSSLSFSVYGTHEIEYYVDNGNSVDIFKQPLNNLNGWTTFTLFVQDDFIYFYKNNKEQIEKKIPTPAQIGIRTSEMAYFKIHTYDYKEANTVTSDQPTTLLIPPHSEKSRLMLYVSLCNSCVLEVHYDTQTVNIYLDTKENNILEKWQIHKLILDPSTYNIVNFIRKKSNDSEEGYWKMDARLYDNENITASYAVDNLSETYSCKYLLTSNNQEQFRRKIHSLAKSATDITNCPTGKLGTRCDISCDNVLGQQYSLCEKHIICSDPNTCKCAWGYHGDWCETKCDDGKWGLNCEKSCAKKCPSCNKQTGDCINIFSNIVHDAMSDDSFRWMAWMIALAVFITLVISTARYYLKTKQPPINLEQPAAALLQRV